MAMEDMGKIMAIVQGNRDVFNEVEQLDVVFRMDLDDAERKEIHPWTMMGREKLRDEEDAVWFSLDESNITKAEATKQFKILMEHYYT